MDQRINLLIRPEGGTPRMFPCAGGQWVQAKDLAQQVVVSIRVDQLSAYRHHLLIEGIAYHILNIVRA